MVCTIIIIGKTKLGTNTGNGYLIRALVEFHISLMTILSD